MNVGLLPQFLDFLKLGMELYELGEDIEKLASCCRPFFPQDFISYDSFKQTLNRTVCSPRWWFCFWFLSLLARIMNFSISWSWQLRMLLNSHNPYLFIRGPDKKPALITCVRKLPAWHSRNLLNCLLPAALCFL